jgi:urease accessory protein
MLTCSQRIAGGAGLSAAQIAAAPTVWLDWDKRQRSRFQATDSQGRVLSVFLPRGQVLRGGDVLLTQNGDAVQVLAAPEQLLRITHGAAHGSAFDLVRAAYHLGNRHVTIELKPDHLHIEPDMLRAMGLTVAEVTEPFEPENGAYGEHGAHGQAHGHRHDHDHDHDHDDGHGHGHDHPHDHGH